MTKKTRLAFRDPKDAEPSKPKFLIFGEAGVGKTWFSMDFPSVAYFDTEGGANRPHYTDKLKKSGGLYLGPEDGTNDFEFLIQQTQALATESHNLRTVVFDSITKPFNTAILNEAERLGDKNAFGADKKPAITQMRRLLNWTTRLDMNVIFICHEKEEWGMVGNKREAIGKTFDGWDKLRYELDVVLRATKRGNARYASISKSRLLGFPESTEFSLSYEEFAKRYGVDIIERQAKQIVLATPEDVAEIKRLVQVLNVPPEDQEKALAKYNVSNYEELALEASKAIIEKLRKKVEPDAQ